MKSNAPSPTKASQEILEDPLLQTVPVVDGFKVLDPALIYAKVGEGGMGAVYVGRHLKLDLDVAIKCLKPSLIDANPQFVKNFEREAKIAASIGHQNVVRVMDVREQDGLHYLVMEYVRGENATERVRRRGPLGEAEALTLLRGAATGLAEAHRRGVVHRDIKPDNILISLDGCVKLADLGLAKSVAGNAEQTMRSLATGGFMGTPQYMPPEQWDTSDVTAAADIWALGATFYFLLTGKHAIAEGPLTAMWKAVSTGEPPSLRRARSDLRPAIHAMFDRCMRKEPAERYQSAGDLLIALNRIEVGPEDLTFQGDGTPRSSPTMVMTRSGFAVSAPPAQTVMKIKAKIDQAGGTAVRPKTQPRPAEVVTPPPKRVWPRVAAGSVAALLIAGVTLHFTGQLDPVLAFIRTSWSPPQADPGQEFRANLERAIEQGLAMEAWRDIDNDAASSDPNLRDAEAEGYRKRIRPLLKDMLVKHCQVRSPRDQAFVQELEVEVDVGPWGEHVRAIKCTSSEAVQGDLVKDSLTGLWRKKLAAPSGSVPFNLEVQDQFGNSHSIPLRVTVDRSPPKLQVAELPTLVGQASIEVACTAEDAAGIQSVVCKDTSLRNAGNRWTGEVPLAEGAQTLVFVCLDRAGNKVEKSAEITVDTKPPVVTCRTDELTRDPSVRLEVAANDTGSGIQSLSLKVISPTSEALPPASYGPGTERIDLDLPKDGVYELELIAKDRAGHTQSWRGSVRRHSALPTATYQGRPIAGGRYEVEVQVGSAVDVAKVMIGDQEATRRDGKWVAEFPYQPGASVKVSVADAAGNELKEDKVFQAAVRENTFKPPVAAVEATAPKPPPKEAPRSAPRFQPNPQFQVVGTDLASDGMPVRVRDINANLNLVAVLDSGRRVRFYVSMEPAGTGSYYDAENWLSRHSGYRLAEESEYSAIRGATNSSDTEYVWFRQRDPKATKATKARWSDGMSGNYPKADKASYFVAATNSAVGQVR